MLDTWRLSQPGTLAILWLLAPPCCCPSAFACAVDATGNALCGGADIAFRSSVKLQGVTDVVNACETG